MIVIVFFTHHPLPRQQEVLEILIQTGGLYSIYQVYHAYNMSNISENIVGLSNIECFL